MSPSHRLPGPARTPHGLHHRLRGLLEGTTTVSLATGVHVAVSLTALMVGNLTGRPNLATGGVAAASLFLFAAVAHAAWWQRTHPVRPEPTPPPA